MKIAFVISYPVLSSTNGIVSQAKTWKVGLQQLGHEVILIDMWEKNDWERFDIIHFFGFGVYMRDMINGLVRVNERIVVSPILDPSYSVSKLRLFSKWGLSRLGLTNPYLAFSSIKNKVQLFLARSEFERRYLVKGFGFPSAKSVVVPLSFDGQCLEKYNDIPKEPFCLHISLLMDERKNVKRLIKAAQKYGFKLVLGGKLHNQNDVETLKGWIGNYSNIEYHGFLSDEQKINLYSKAKVFALPSTNEGVGIVGLEAASCGCDIVITEWGGPKEYYNNLAKIVNPYDVDEIGIAILDFINGKSFQPNLSRFIRSEYSHQVIAKKLEECYQGLIN